MKHTECKEKGHTISLTLTIALEKLQKNGKIEVFSSNKKEFRRVFLCKRRYNKHAERQHDVCCDRRTENQKQEVVTIKKKLAIL